MVDILRVLSRLHILAPTSPRELEAGMASAGANDDIDLITLMPLSSYPPQALYTTTDGHRYHLESLREWLIMSPQNVMPHSNTLAPEDRRRVLSEPARRAVVQHLRPTLQMPVLAESVDALGESGAMLTALCGTMICWPGFVTASMFYALQPANSAASKIAMCVMGAGFGVSIFGAAATSASIEPFRKANLLEGPIFVARKCAGSHGSLGAALMIAAFVLDCVSNGTKKPMPIIPIAAAGGVMTGASLLPCFLVNQPAWY